MNVYSWGKKRKKFIKKTTYHTGTSFLHLIRSSWRPYKIEWMKKEYRRKHKPKGKQTRVAFHYEQKKKKKKKAKWNVHIMHGFYLHNCCCCSKENIGEVCLSHIYRVTKWIRRSLQYAKLIFIHFFSSYFVFYFVWIIDWRRSRGNGRMCTERRSDLTEEIKRNDRFLSVAAKYVVKASRYLANALANWRWDCRQSGDRTGR